MTVERAELVQFWPLVDVGRLDLQPGDVVIVRSKAIAEDRLLARLFLDVWERHLPGVRVMIDGGHSIEFAVKRRMPDMRAEDLVQPVRRSTMEAP